MHTDPVDPRARFSDRASAYAAARPAYPDAVAVTLARELDLRPGAIVVDLGSGTGLSCEPFLRAGFAVVGVEPNEAMRAEGERHLAAYPAFRSVPGQAEATGLPAASCGLVIAAQAFHWFDIAAARREALRILQAPPRAALIWNDRRVTGSAFAEGYERLLQEFGTDYNEVRHRHAHPESVSAFFGDRSWRMAVFPNPTELDFETLAARVNSASYMPGPGAPAHAAMMARLRELFDSTQRAGRVLMEYDTRAFHGTIAPGA
jgi:SAM-dependent methyltransferase